MGSEKTAEAAETGPLNGMETDHNLVAVVDLEESAQSPRRSSRQLALNVVQNAKCLLSLRQVNL
ncbi:MAG: hypothetical protein ABIA93_05490 [Candidatus Woesearchaeota archaeon]